MKALLEMQNDSIRCNDVLVLVNDDFWLCVGRGFVPVARWRDRSFRRAQEMFRPRDWCTRRWATNWVPRGMGMVYPRDARSFGQQNQVD